MIGPKITIEASCYNCEHCRTERYACQGDSGTDVRCAAVENKLVGDSRWDTPAWCPFVEDAKRTAAQSLLNTKLRNAASDSRPLDTSRDNS